MRIAPLRLGIAQTNPVFGDRHGNIQRAFDLLRAKADLWILPEFFATGYQFTSPEEAWSLSEAVPDGPTVDALHAFAAERTCHVVAGLPERANNRLFNACVLVGPRGHVATYRKIHLFDEEQLYFAPGNRPFEVTKVGETLVGMMICFDHLFPESARSLSLLGADVIAHPANLVLPDLAQRTMRVRALENGVFTATANRVGTEHRTDTVLRYTGQSQIVSPRGDVLVRLSPDRDETAVVVIDPAEAREKGITPRNDKLADRRPRLYRL